MRKINMRWQSVLLSVALLGLAACTGDFEDINRNPNQVTEEQMDALNYKTGTKFKSLQSLVIPVQEHMYQFNESLSAGRSAVTSVLRSIHGRPSSRPIIPRPTGVNGLSPTSSPRPIPPPIRASSTARKTKWPSLSPACCEWPSCTV